MRASSQYEATENHGIRGAGVLPQQPLVSDVELLLRRAGEAKGGGGVTEYVVLGRVLAAVAAVVARERFDLSGVE